MKGMANQPSDRRRETAPIKGAVKREELARWKVV